MANNPPPDFLIHATEWATMWGFEPKTEAAQEFLDSIGGEGWEWSGNIFYADHRPARDLARHMVGEGFIVLHPDYGYFGG